ncbi:MAG: hypothetical protein WAK95_13435, partial [Desulfobacterales bacterium]
YRPSAGLSSRFPGYLFNEVSELKTSRCRPIVIFAENKQKISHFFPPSPKELREASVKIYPGHSAPVETL